MILIFIALIMDVQAQQELSRKEILEISQKHFQEGERFYNQGDYSRADEEFKKAQILLEGLKEVIIEEKKEDISCEDQPKKTEEDYNGLVKKALEYAKSNKSEEAITYYLKAIALQPNNPDPHYNLAIEYLKTQNFSQAAEELKKVIELNPKDSDAYYNLGVLYEDYLKDLELAKFYYTQYLKLSPHAPDAEDVKKWLRRIDKGVKER